MNHLHYSPTYKRSYPDLRAVQVFASDDFTRMNTELERLNNLCRTLDEENQRLKMRSHHDERLAAENQSLHYEVRTLRDSIHSFESQIADLTRENSRLSFELNQRINEVEEWRMKYIRLEQSKSQIIPQLHYVESPKAHHHTIHHDEEYINQLKSQIETLRSERDKFKTLSERVREIEVVKTSHHHQDDDYIHQLKVQIETLRSERDKFKTLSERVREKEVIKTIHKESNEDYEVIQGLKRKLTILQTENADLSLENEALRKSEVKVKTVVIEKDVKSPRHEEMTIKELKAKISVLVCENENLRHDIDHKLHEIHSLKLQLEKDPAVIAELKHKLSMKVTENEKQSLTISNKTREIARKDKEIEELKHKIHIATEVEQNLRSQLKDKEAITKENRRLNGLLSERFEEINKLKVDITRLNIIIQNFDAEKHRFEMRIAEKINEADMLKERITELERKAASIIELQGRINILIIENERLNGTVLEKTHVIEDWMNKYITLENLYKSVRETTQQLETIERKYQDAVHTQEHMTSHLRLSGADSKILNKSTVVQKVVQIEHEHPVNSKIQTIKTYEGSPLHVKQIVQKFL